MRYGTRIMLELALRDEQAPVSSGEIAASEELSRKYVESLMVLLRTAGLVQSARGAQGGYKLSRPSQGISLYDLFQALEGTEAFVPCSAAAAACPRYQACVTRDVWAEMLAATTRVLRETALADLAERSRIRQAESAAYVYSI